MPKEEVPVSVRRRGLSQRPLSMAPTARLTSNHDIVLPKELAPQRPERLLLHDLVLRSRGNLVRQSRAIGDGLDVLGLKGASEGGKKSVEGDLGVVGVLHDRVIAVELDELLGLHLVREFA